MLRPAGSRQPAESGASRRWFGSTHDPAIPEIDRSSSIDFEPARERVAALGPVLFERIGPNPATLQHGHVWARIGTRPTA
jgi:hypothetical protein